MGLFPLAASRSRVAKVVAHATLPLLVVAGLLLAPAGASAGPSAPGPSRVCGAPCFIHLSFHGSGSGRVVSTWTESEGPKTVECRSACVVVTDFGVVVTMTALPDQGSTFTSLVGPGGCENNSEPRCTFFMDFERDMDVTFDGAGLPQPAPSPQAPAPPPLSSTPPPPVSSPPPAGPCTIVGTERDDVLAATRENDVICGLGGDDHIHVGGGHDVVYAGLGNDVVEVGFGTRPVVYGGGGSDRVEGGSGAERVFGGSGGDSLRGGAGADRLLGQEGADRLVGGPGHDTLLGGAGRDRIEARDGRPDTVDGGAGRDAARIDRFDRVRIVERRLAAGTAEPQTACAGPCTLNVVKLGTGSGTVRGAGGQIDCGLLCTAQTDYDVWLTLTATPSPGSVFTGWVGDCQPAVGDRCEVHMIVGPVNYYAVFDRIGAPPTPLVEPGSGSPPQPPSSPPPPPGTPNPRGCTIMGTAGDDFLAGTSRREVICGLGGKDHIHGGGGNDLIYGDAGNDDVDAHGGNDRVYGGAGKDFLAGLAGSDVLIGGAGPDVLVGGAGRDRLYARDGFRDLLNGGAGSDTGYTDRRDRVRALESRLP